MSSFAITTQGVVEFATVKEDDAQPLLGDESANILSAGGNMVIWGSEGASKTTLALDLAFHFASGTDWLSLDVPEALRVLFIENEGPRGPLRRKVAAKLEAWEGDAPEHLSFLIEPWGRFSFRDELTRGELAAKIISEGTQVLIVGPVSTLGMLGAGTPLDVREFMDRVDDLRAEVVRRNDGKPRPLAVIFVHHDNKAGNISGAWGPAPDTLVHVTLQGHGHTRVHWQKCRWASKLHGTSFQLAWTDGEGFELEERQEATEETIADEILEYVRANGGTSWNKIEKGTGGKGERKRQIRNRLLAGGRLVDSGGKAGMKLWHVDDPACPSIQDELCPNGDTPGTHV